ncbi:Na+/H+ antiporter subunit E [Cellulomonas phragmiteti]|uniref:Sodium:proton antiporter n=1 Tax=Cellulomonas phragmiteti TaxID=478780 RepID=A0ABQ4DQ21_9CELL|nr:Na+/H+ antiporter subunit E [Cellulomonas phragmiteti]GIG41443.1 sodium:proton antiporter [Cellulomonas phragmiteti]
MSLHPRRTGWRFQWVTIVWLTIVWVLLWGDITWGNLVTGVLLGVLVTAGLRMTPVDFRGRVHPVALLVLLGRFALDLVRASFEVSAVALRPRYTPRGAVICVQLRSHSDLYLTMTAELVSLVPGSIIVEAHRLTGRLYVHVLDVETSGGVEQARQNVLDQEARLLRAIGSDEELADAGLHRGRRAREVAAR